MPKKYAVEKTFTFEGKRYHVRGDSDADVIAKMALKKRDLEEGRVVISGSMLLKDWAEKCIDIYKPNQSDNTKREFQRLVKKNILEDLGNMQLKKIRPIHCQEIMNQKTGMSPTHINHVYQALRFLFRYAKQNKLIVEDPTEGLVRPKARPKGSRRALTPKERSHMISVAQTDRRYYFYLLMLLCGCRPSEAAKCKGEDIQIHDGHYMLHIRGTKTEKSDRLVPIPPSLLDLIKDTPSEEYIAPNSAGNMQNRQGMKRLWHSFTRQLNLSMGCKTYRNALVPPYPLADDLVPYCLRHEYCTELARKGVDIRIAQKLMGHSSINMTANIYTNLSSNDIYNVAEIIDNVAPTVTPNSRHVEK